MNSASIPENRSLLCLSSNESRTAKVFSRLLSCTTTKTKRQLLANKDKVIIQLLDASSSNNE